MCNCSLRDKIVCAPDSNPHPCPHPPAAEGGPFESCLAGVYIAPSPIEGDGLFANRQWKKGCHEPIIRYLGDVCAPERGAVSAHVFQPRGGLPLDGAKSGVAARINASDKPNAELRESGGFYAIRDINIKDEITISRGDYGRSFCTKHMPKRPAAVAFHDSPQVRTYLPPPRAPTCPKGNRHGPMRYQKFDQANSERKTLTCDGDFCYVRIRHGEFVWSCDACDRDLCTRCADRAVDIEQRRCVRGRCATPNRPQSPG